MSEERIPSTGEDDARVFKHAADVEGPRSVWDVTSQPLELRRLVTLVVIIAAAAIIVLNFDVVLKILGKIWGICVPLAVGACFAYLLNLVMVRWEAIWFPRSKNAAVNSTRRIVCILLSLTTVALVVTLAVLLVSDEIGEAFSALGEGLSAAFAALGSVLKDYGLLQADSPLMDIVPKNAEGWQQLVTEALSFLGGASGLLSSALGVSGHVAGAAIDSVVTVVFAVYLLSGKERILKGARRFGRWVLRERRYGQLEHACQVANGCFSRFIVGQCTEALILGCLVALGMTIFDFPYAASVAFCVGVTSLVPLVGAWIGGILGALMIMSVSFVQAIWFAVFLVVLQQIEGHVIYPHVVGAAVGVPGIWVLVAVFAGGSLFGVAGVLLGVPVIATLKELMAEAQSAGSLGEGPSGGGGGSGGGSSGGGANDVTGDVPAGTSNGGSISESACAS